MRSLVVLLTYNEFENLSANIESIHEHASDAHVLIVDDNSPDGTGKLADKLSAQHPDKVFVLHRGGKRGLRAAYVAGFKSALARNYDIIVQMDADFSHDAKYLADFFEQIRERDVMIGSRYVTGISVVNWDLKRL